MLLSIFYHFKRIGLNRRDRNIIENKKRKCNEELVLKKNRLCCPKDSEPLITILEGKVVRYEMNITCKSSQSIY